MTDLEFDVLDELYFVTPYKDLVSNLDLSEKEVLQTLKQLNEKKWVKCFINESDELLPDEVDLENNIVEVWNGGNPPVFVTNADKKIVKQFDSNHLALGILPDKDFNEKTDKLKKNI